MVTGTEFSSWTLIPKKMYRKQRASKRAQGKKVLATKADDLSSNPEDPHCTKRE